METDREKHGLRGSVKSVLVETARFEEQAGQIIERPWFGQTMIFNQDGWLTEQIYLNPDGSEWRAVSDYSDSGKLLRTRSYESSGALVSEVRYVYDSEERLVAEQHITQDGKVTTPISYAYDTGVKIKIQELDFFEEATLMVGIEGTMSTIDASEAKRIETRYDDHDKPVEVKVFNTAGSLVSRMEITRDVQGNPLEETQYHGDEVRFGPGSSCSTEEIESLTQEQKAELAAVVEQMFSPGTVMSKHTHKYDVEGRLVESELTMMGMVVNRKTFAYDEAGNKSEEVSYNEYAPIAGNSIFTREYDEYGNWTKELVSTVSSSDVEFGLSTPVHVTRRTITYYT